MSFPVNYLDRVDEATLIAELAERDLVATRVCDPFGGQVARMQIDVYGESAAEVESTLLEFASRCDAASQASEVTYGRCVIERNLDAEWGATYSWRGRLTLHPTIGSERAAGALRDAIAESLPGR